MLKEFKFNIFLLSGDSEEIVSKIANKLNIKAVIDNEDQDNPFLLNISGYEGAIDLLLDLARKQKVDLTEISILELANQYISFINQFQDIHLFPAALPVELFYKSAR